MQVNSINNNNTSFGARFRVKPKDIDHVMSAIEQSDIKGLRRIYKALKTGETGKGSKDIIYIEDASVDGKKVRPKYCGFLKAKIGDWTYTNDVVPTFSFWSLPHFFEKIQRLSKEKYTSPWKNSTKRLCEINEQCDIMFDKALDGKSKGSIEPCRRRDYLLDAIHSILTKK